jgi:Ca2+-binding RTX toxin-like protein
MGLAADTPTAQFAKALLSLGYGYDRSTFSIIDEDGDVVGNAKDMELLVNAILREDMDAGRFEATAPVDVDAGSIEDAVVVALDAPVSVKSSFDTKTIHHSDDLSLTGATISFAFLANKMEGSTSGQTLFSKDAARKNEGDLKVYFYKDNLFVQIVDDGDTRKFKVPGEFEDGVPYDFAMILGEKGLGVWVDGALALYRSDVRTDWSENTNNIVVGANNEYQSKAHQAGMSDHDDMGMDMMGDDMDMDMDMSEDYGPNMIHPDDTLKGFFQGTITDFTVYDRVLDTAEITSLANSGETKTGTDGEDDITGTAANDALYGGMDRDVIEAGDGDDVAYGGYGSDAVDGGDGDDVLDGGYGNDIVRGGEGNDILISSSDGWEPEMGQWIYGSNGRIRQDNGDFPEGADKLYPDQPVPGDDILIGGAGADTYRFQFMINAKEEIIEKHTRDDGKISWRSIAGENDFAHDHWVDTINNDMIVGFNREEGDRIEIAGHTLYVYELDHYDGDGDGTDDTSLITFRSKQGGGGAHDRDDLGTVKVTGDLVQMSDIYQIHSHDVFYGIVGNIADIDEAITPLEISDAPPRDPVAAEMFAVADETPLGEEPVGDDYMPPASVAGVEGQVTVKSNNHTARLEHSDALALASGTVAFSFVALRAESSRQTLFSKDGRGTKQGDMKVYLDEGELIVSVVNGGKERKVTLYDEFESNVAYEFAMTFGEGGISVWIDGEEVATRSMLKADWTTNANDIVVGADNGFTRSMEMSDDNMLMTSTGPNIIHSHGNLKNFFQGSISDFTVYDGALSGAEIQALANSGETKFGTDGEDDIMGTDGNDVIDGGMGRDVIKAGDGDDVARGGYGNDVVEGEDGDDVLDGGYGMDIVRGGAGNDIIISTSDGWEPDVGQFIYGSPGRVRRDDGDFPEGADKLYPDQPVPADDVFEGGSGADTFRFQFTINGEKDVIEDHARDNGSINWRGVAGENDFAHDHWVDGIGNDKILDFNRGEGDRIEVAGHTLRVKTIEYGDSDGDGADDFSTIIFKSFQAGGGAHANDDLGTVEVHGDLVTWDDIYQIHSHSVFYGVVGNIADIEEAAGPLEISEGLARDAMAEDLFA